MIDIIVAPELWASSILPEGILETWLVADGTHVKAGEAVACIRIEDALHDLISPADGRLVIEAQENAVLEPGTIVAQVAQETAPAHEPA